jgi:hypothetical protein
MISGQLSKLLAELSFSSKLKEFDLFEDKEVNPCYIVSHEEFLVIQELLNLFHPV